MKNKIKPVKRTNKRMKSDFMLILINLLITLVVFLFVCLFSYITSVKSELYFTMSLASFALSGFITGAVSGKWKHHKGLINGIVHSFISGSSLIIISLIANKLLFDYRVLVSIAVIILSGAVGGVFSVNIKRKIKN